MKILIVDDDALTAQALAVGVQMQGHEAIVTDSHRIRLFPSDEPLPDAVFLDIPRSKRKGVEVLRRIRAACPALPVVLFTDGIPPHERAEATRLGVTDIVEKPAVLARLGQSATRCSGVRSRPKRVRYGRRAAECGHRGAWWRRAHVDLHVRPPATARRSRRSRTAEAVLTPCRREPPTRPSAR